MVSLWASRPEWSCHWSVVPICVKLPTCAAVPKPLNTRIHLGAVEVGNGRAVGAAGEEHEHVVAVVANQGVRTEGDQRVGAAAAGTDSPEPIMYSASTLADRV